MKKGLEIVGRDDEARVVVGQYRLRQVFQRCCCMEQKNLMVIVLRVQS